MEIPVAVLVGLIAALGTGLGTWASLRRTRSSLKQQIDVQIDKRVTEELTRAYHEIDELKKQAEKSQTRDRAIGNVLQALAAQWPPGTRPVLNPRDLAVLDDIVPPQWRAERKSNHER